MSPICPNCGSYYVRPPCPACADLAAEVEAPPIVSDSAKSRVQAPPFKTRPTTLKQMIVEEDAGESGSMLVEDLKRQLI